MPMGSSGTLSSSVVGELSASLTARMHEILQECDCKDLNYNYIRGKLEREFGPKAVASSRRCINVAVCNELSARHERCGSVMCVSIVSGVSQ